MRHFMLLGLLAALLAGCGDKSAVSLTTTLQDPTVSVMTEALGASLSGGFQLEFELGPEAANSTTVSLGSFALHDQAGNSLIDALPLSASGGSFPLTVTKGAPVTVTLTVNLNRVLTATESTDICAGTVRFVGSVSDSTSTVFQFTSPLLTPTCS